ncbi:MAG: hypothetical protein IJV81_08120 [Paludibacteraceae bacterium]|nr:hypothetical protein [Paludibacteraceae bacterium]
MRKLEYILLIIAAIATFVYLMVLGVFATPSADDFGFTAMVRDKGICNLVKTMYMTWQCRYVSFFVNGIVFKFFGYAESLWLHTLLHLLMGYISVYLLINRITTFQNRLLPIIISILLVNIGLMSLLEISTLYWLCTAGYIRLVWVTILLTYFILYERKEIVQTLGTIICSIYIGGSSEVYTPLVILTLLVSLIVRVYVKKTYQSFNNRLDIHILISIVILSVGFLLVFFGPGNDVRIAAVGERGFVGNFEMIPFFRNLFKATIVFLIRLLSKSWYYLLTIGIAAMIGRRFCIYRIGQRYILCATFFVLFIILLSVAMGVYATGWYAPLRAYSYLSFVLLAYFVLIGIAIGQRCLRVEIFSIVASIAITITSIIYLFVEYPVIKKYHSEVINVKQELFTLAKNEYKGVYEVKKNETEQWRDSYSILRNQIERLFNKPPKYNGIYFPYEPFMVTIDANHWRNKGLVYWCGGNFTLVGWAEPD